MRVHTSTAHGVPPLRTSRGGPLHNFPRLSCRKTLSQVLPADPLSFVNDDPCLMFVLRSPQRWREGCLQLSLTSHRQAGVFRPPAIRMNFVHPCGSLLKVGAIAMAPLSPKTCGNKGLAKEKARTPSPVRGGNKGLALTDAAGISHRTGMGAKGSRPSQTFTLRRTPSASLRRAPTRPP